MRCRKTIYCECQFVKSLPQDQIDDFYRFSNESVIVFDITYSQFIQESCNDTIFKYIRKRQQAGGCELKFDYSPESLNEDCKNQRINSFNPIILIYQTNKQRRTENKCVQYIFKYGILAADQNDFLDKCYLTKDFGFAIKKQTENNWKNLLVNIPFYGNSLIIVDNYLLSDSKTYENNLKPILESLLPDSLETVYNISFYTQDSNSTLKLKVGKVEEMIRMIRPNLQLNVNFFIDVKSIFHDRVIISNYFWMNCGAGFDLFNSNSKAKHSTTVSILYPFMQNQNPWAIDAFVYLFEDAKEMANAAVNNGPVKQYYGVDKNNRLFEMQ